MDVRTAGIVAKELAALGFDEKTGIGKTGVVGVKLPDGTEVPVAHMCGHDAHVTWMLGMAKAKVALKSD